MKIKNILFISLVIGIGILIFLIVLNVSKKKNYNVKQTNDVIEESIDKTKDKRDYSINYKKNNKSSNSNSDLVGSKKSEIDKADSLITDSDSILIKDPYYFQSNWIVEEVVISEERESLSFFEKLDGKKAKVTKETKVAYKWLKDIEDEDSYVKNSFVLVPISTGSDIAYKYYFDSSGYLITDNISKDYTVLDYLGREIDKELKPVEYYIGSKYYSIEHIEKPYDSKKMCIMGM